MNKYYLKVLSYSCYIFILREAFTYQPHTVKLGYNELGYNEHPVIKNKTNTIGWFQSFFKFLPSYNKQNPVITKKG